jgi:mannose-6-phosphate isomerase
MLYPFVMEPVYKNYLWGGRSLQKYGKNLPKGIVAEAWEASAHADGLSRVANGAFAGKTLKDVIDAYPQDIMGAEISSRYGQQLPLLFKLIDANDRLSVQVHPDDAYARAQEGQPFGKYEAWYILEAAPGSTIVYGLTPDTDKEAFGKALKENRVSDCLNTVLVQAGDLFEVKPGLVHAIGSGIVLAELQQNSNLTYRVYDYDRLDAQGNLRELHIQKALDVIAFEPVKGGNTMPGQYNNAAMLRNDYFALEVMEIKNQWMEIELGGFSILFVCEGEADIRYAGGVVRAVRGKTVFMPAALERYAISGPCKILRMDAALPTLR